MQSTDTNHEVFLVASSMRLELSMTLKSTLIFIPHDTHMPLQAYMFIDNTTKPSNFLHFLQWLVKSDYFEECLRRLLSVQVCSICLLAATGGVPACTSPTFLYLKARVNPRNIFSYSSW
jgi:hypothetical protein